MEEKDPIGNFPILPHAIHHVEQLGSVIKSIRKDQGLTQIDVAGLAGFGNRFVIDLEKGKETIQMQKAMDVIALLGLELLIRKKGDQ